MNVNHDFSLPTDHPFQYVLKPVSETIQYSGTVLLAAIASEYFFSHATTGLLAAFGTTFLVRVVDKIWEELPDEKFKNYRIQLLRYLYDLDKKYPKLSLIALVFSAAISPISSSLSLFCGIGYGLYKGLLIVKEKVLSIPTKASYSLSTLNSPI